LANGLNVFHPMPISDGAVEVFGLDIMLIAEPFDLTYRLMPDALADKERSPMRRRRMWVHQLAKAQRIAVAIVVVPVKCLQSLRWRCE
jgi:hypothetical protein